MKPWKTLDRAAAPGGGELVLQERDGQYVIRLGGQELMSSRMHGSEEAMARLGRERTTRHPAPRVLIGGLGLGYTLRAALDAFPRITPLTVAELSPAVVRWNREVLGALAGEPLRDKRVTVVEEDVLTCVRRSPAAFEAILLDVDNGPHAMSPASGPLYRDAGIAAFHRALAPGGVLIVWSAAPDEAYLRRLERGDFAASVVSHVERGRRHVLFVGERRERPPRKQ